MLSAVEGMENKVTTEVELPKTMKSTVEDSGVKDGKDNSFDPWIVFTAGQAAAKEESFEEAADLFSSVLANL